MILLSIQIFVDVAAVATAISSMAERAAARYVRGSKVGAALHSLMSLIAVRCCVGSLMPTVIRELWKINIREFPIPPFVTQVRQQQLEFSSVPNGKLWDCGSSAGLLVMEWQAFVV
jgi:hypothetical protein